MNTFTNEEALILSGLFKMSKNVVERQKNYIRPYTIKIGKVEAEIYSNGVFKINMGGGVND